MRFYRCYNLRSSIRRVSSNWNPTELFVMPHMVDGKWVYFVSVGILMRRCLTLPRLFSLEFQIGEPTYKDTASSELSIKSKVGITQEYKKIIAEHNATNPFEDLEFPRTDPATIGPITFDTAQGKQFPDWDGTFQWKRAKVRKTYPFCAALVFSKQPGLFLNPGSFCFLPWC